MKSTKKALLLSITSMILCIAMLMGTTFAWFTDTVTSGSNRIIAGNLDVDLVMYDKDQSKYVSIGGDDGDIFSQAAGGNGVNWEPGKTEIVYLGVKNNGSLALKYNILLRVVDGGLVGSLRYAIIDGVSYSQAQGYGLTKWTDITSLTGVQTGMVESGVRTVATGGILDEIVNGTEGEIDYFVLAVHMEESAGNEYMSKPGAEKYVEIDLTVNATQKEAENDSFGNDYDHIENCLFNGHQFTFDETTGEFSCERCEKNFEGPYFAVLDNSNKPIEIYELNAANGKELSAYGVSFDTVPGGTRIYYTNKGFARNVAFRTDGGELVLDAPNDTISRYNKIDNVYVLSVADHSFTDYGTVGDIYILGQGNVVIKDSATVNDISVAKTANAEKVSIITGDNANVGAIAIHKEQQDAVKVNDGTAKTKADTDSNVVVIPEDKAARVGTVCYDTFEEARTAAGTNDVVRLINDSETSVKTVIEAEEKVLIEFGVTLLDFNGNGLEVKENGELHLCGEFISQKAEIVGETVINNGKIVNDGVFSNKDGQTFTNNSQIVNYGSFKNSNGSKFENNGTISIAKTGISAPTGNKGTSINEKGGTLDNDGTFVNKETGTIINNGVINNDTTGTVENNGSVVSDNENSEINNKEGDSNWTGEKEIAHTHALTKHNAVAPTCTVEGNSEYYTCSCGKCFADADGKNEIVVNSWRLKALGHDFDADGKCQREGCDSQFTAKIGDIFYANPDAIKAVKGDDTTNWTDVEFRFENEADKTAFEQTVLSLYVDLVEGSEEKWYKVAPTAAVTKVVSSNGAIASYDTLVAAFNKVVSGDTVVLMADLTEQNIWWSPKAGNYTLDLNGNKIEGKKLYDPTYTLYVYGQAGTNVTITDSSDHPGSIIGYGDAPYLEPNDGHSMNGTLYIRTQNSGDHMNVTLENVNIVSVKGECAINSEITSGKESLVVKSGKIDGDIYLNLRDGRYVVSTVFDCVDYKGETKVITPNPSYKLKTTSQSGKTTYGIEVELDCDLYLSDPYLQTSGEYSVCKVSGGNLLLNMSAGSSNNPAFKNIKVYRDFTANSYFSITAGEYSVPCITTFDINGKTVTANNGLTFISNTSTKYAPPNTSDYRNRITICDTVGGGKIIAKNSSIYVNSVELIINGGVFDIAQFQTGVANGSSNRAKGVVTINDGNFTMSGSLLQYYPLTINGGTFTVPATQVDILKGYVTSGSTVTINGESYTAPQAE